MSRDWAYKNLQNLGVARGREQSHHLFLRREDEVAVRLLAEEVLPLAGS
jgi:hypothetical protein